MASVISAGTTSTTALNLSGDTTGVLQLQTNGTTAITIDSSQNVGIGATPSAWSAYKGLNIGLNATLAGSTGGSVALLSTNAYFDGSSYKYISTDAATQYQQNTGQHIWRGAASGTAGNTLTFTQILALERTKSLALEGASSQSGTGITFPATQSASSDANTLDDYEEGTWTPTLVGSSTAGTYNFTTTYAIYTKIGNQVTINAYLLLNTASGGSGAAKFGGLPFTKSANQLMVGSAGGNSLDFGANTTSITLLSWTFSASTEFYISETNDNGTETALSITGISSGDGVWFSATYFV